MNIVYGGRATGKSTWLRRWAEGNDGHILVANAMMRDHVRRALEVENAGKRVHTVQSLLSSRGLRIDRLGVDDVDLVLGQVFGVVPDVATMTGGAISLGANPSAEERQRALESVPRPSDTELALQRAQEEIRDLRRRLSRAEEMERQAFQLAASVIGMPPKAEPAKDETDER